MTVTLRDIASKLGVSEMTVSRALRGTGRMTDDTRVRIAHAARSLGYRPNMAARSTRMGRLATVAFVRSKTRDRSWFPIEMLDSIQSELEQHSQRLLMSTLDDRRLDDPEYLPHFLQNMAADGMLLNYITQFRSDLADLLMRYRLPTIWLNTRRPHDCVFPDDEHAGYQATQTMLQRGHRRLVYVSFRGGLAPDKQHYSNIDRKQGYLRAMRESGVEPQLLELPADFYLSQNNEEAAYQVVQRLWSQPVLPQTLVCYGGRESVAILEELRRRNIPVPQQVSIVGSYWANELAQLHNLTGMYVPEVPLGAAAVHQLMIKIDKPKELLAPRAIAYQWREGGTVGNPVN